MSTLSLPNNSGSHDISGKLRKVTINTNDSINLFKYKIKRYEDEILLKIQLEEKMLNLVTH